MQTVTEHIRAHLLSSFGYVEARPRRMPGLDELRRTEWAPEFEALMRNRLIMAAFRYGRFRDPGKAAGYDFVRAMRQLIAEYEACRNTEKLVDLANYALLEFTFGKHPDKHWRAEDDHSHCPRH